MASAFVVGKCFLVWYNNYNLMQKAVGLMISDFRCTFDNAIGISPEITKDLKLSFPDAYMHADTMAKIAHAIKEKEGAAFCMLPFCHTVEAEAMGGIVNMGDW